MDKYKIKPPEITLTWELSGPNPPNFDPMILPSPQKGFMMGICGGRNTGKSVVLHNLLKHYAGAFDNVYIMSPTHKQDPTIGPEATGLEETSYFECIDEDFILDLIRKQEAEKKKYDNNTLRQKYLSRYLIVMDDCISDKNFSNQSNQGILNKLGYKSRHWRISVILTSQHYRSLPKRLRCNIPNFIFMRTYNEGERKSIADEQSNILSEKVFNEMFDTAIQDPYSFFYIFLDSPDKNKCFRKNLDTILNYKE